ncbi:MAG TPA: hypothetical protein VL490_01045 [Mucilaginibacter sp.]|nr:hypothetical protein [Mucilaginibacter sp.]
MKYYTSLIILVLFFSACKSSIKPESLYGKWNYTRIKSNITRPDSITAARLKVGSPYIEFTQKDSLFIYWSGGRISRGIFTTDGDSIVYKEDIDYGTRVFPFIVTELTDKKIVFYTKGAEGSEVTAVKQ